MPELLGRLPNKIDLKPLTKNDFRQILTDVEFSLLEQYKALMRTEDIDIEFSEDGIDRIAESIYLLKNLVAEEMNLSQENIGARRLHNLLESILEEISYAACESEDKYFLINEQYVEDRMRGSLKRADYAKYIL